MTTPDQVSEHEAPESTKLLRVAIWVAIGALIVAALVCVVMVLIGSAGGIVGRAFLTVLLLAAFAGVALLDTYLARRRPVWFALLSMVVWVATLLAGAVMTWLPTGPAAGFAPGGQRFVSFLLIVLILQLGVLHVRLYLKAWAHGRTAFTTSVTSVTLVLVGLLAVMLVFPLILQEWVRFHDIYWRLTVSVAILAAVGTALVPLVNALFASHERPARPAYAPVANGWPTYNDGVTPLPALPDGRPDWSGQYVPPQSAPAGAPASQQAAGYPAAPAPVPSAGAWTAPEPTPPAAPEHAPAPAAPQPAAPQNAPAPAPGQTPNGAATPVDPSWPAPHADEQLPPRPPLPGEQE